MTAEVDAARSIQTFTAVKVQELIDGGWQTVEQETTSLDDRVNAWLQKYNHVVLSVAVQANVTIANSATLRTLQTVYVIIYMPYAAFIKLREFELKLAKHGGCRPAAGVTAAAPESKYLLSDKVDITEIRQDFDI